MSTETTQPADQAYDYTDGQYNYQDGGYNYGDQPADGGTNYQGYYDEQGNWVSTGDGDAYDGYDYNNPPQDGGYDQGGYDGGGGSGNPMNELNTAAAGGQQATGYVQQQGYDSQNPRSTSGGAGGDQEMTTRGAGGAQGAQQAQPAVAGGGGGQQDLNNLSPQEMALLQQQLQLKMAGGNGGNLTNAQAQQMVLNQSGPDALRQKLSELLGKSPGTSLPDHKPASDGWIADVLTHFGLSLGFKLYMSYLLWSCLVLYIMIGFDYIYSTLYRMMAPPDPGQSLFGQSAAYLCIFFALSFLIISMVCVVVDMMRDFWTANRDEPMLWGMRCFETKPPFPIYGILIVLTIFVPVVWSLIAVGDMKQSFWFFWQHLAYTTQTMAMFICLIVFIWFWIRAAREKGRALARRSDSPDECPRVRQTYLLEDGGKPDVFGALTQQQPDLDKVTTWWRSDIVMQEWGLDQSAILWMIVVFALTFSPLLIILVFLATEGDSTGWEAGWLVLAVIFFCALILLHQTAMSRRKKGLSAVCALLGVCAFILMGFIGGGAAGNGALVGVFVVLLLLTQGMMTRKRLYDMTRREIYHHFKQPFDEEAEHDRSKKIWDSYCCCCQKLAFSCCGCCFDINKVFGHQYPEIEKLVRTERKKRVALRTDQNFLAAFWWLLCIALIIILSISRLLLLNWADSHIAETENTSGNGAVKNELPACGITLGGKMTMYEMSLLASLTLSAGERGKGDYGTWFASTHPTLLPNYEKYDSNQFLQSRRSEFSFVGYAANTNTTSVNNTATNYVAVRWTSAASSFMQSLDVWSDSISFQIAGTFAPHMLIWPTVQKSSFIHGVSFLKRIYGGKDMMGDIENYVRSLKGDTILVGYGFGGGAAQIVAMKTGQKAVSFNGPGIGWLFDKYSFPNPVTSADAAKKIVSVSSARNLYSLIDAGADYGATQTIECSSDSHQTCTDLGQLVRTLKDRCGDAYGRKLK